MLQIFLWACDRGFIRQFPGEQGFQHLFLMLAIVSIVGWIASFAFYHANTNQQVI
jgi:hypothetical protein